MTELKGKVIIRAITDAAARERVIAFICSHGGKPPADKVRARLEQLPLTLVSSMDAGKGERLAATLCGLGADAGFVDDAIDPPAAVPVPVVAEPLAAPLQAEPVQREAQARPPKPDRTARLKAAAPTEESEKLRIAHACRFVLVYAILSTCVSFYSPYFYLFSLPMALYAAHRATALQKTDIWLRCLYFVSVFVPVANLVILSLLTVQMHLILKRSNASNEVGQDELAQLRFTFRIGYACTMVIFLVGTAGGYLSGSMSDLGETVERRLAKDVKRSAKLFPKQMDKGLRIEKMTAGPDRRLTFHCTLTNFKAKSIDSEQLRSGVGDKLVGQICDSKEMRYYLERDVVISYAFNGNDDLPITSIDVTNKNCDKES